MNIKIIPKTMMVMNNVQGINGWHTKHQEVIRSTSRRSVRKTVRQSMLDKQYERDKSYSILFYSILFYSILFYSIYGLIKRLSQYNLIRGASSVKGPSKKEKF